MAAPTVTLYRKVLEKMGSDGHYIDDAAHGCGVFLDFLEIGTSDFDTLIQAVQDDSVGISVEPIDEYLSRLPDRPGCQKINAAISDQTGSASVFYVDPLDITRFNLSDWFRGCNSIDGPHNTVVRFLAKNGLSESLIKKREIAKNTLFDFMAANFIDGIYLLKIDTEGHDVVILERFLKDATPARLPQHLKFETNVLSSSEAVHQIIAKLILLGYDIVHSRTGGAETNTVLRLNVSRMTRRDTFSSPRAGYYLRDYPRDYDPLNLPHENTLADAKRFCRSIDGGGVTLQHGRYEVRRGTDLFRSAHRTDPTSWVMLPSQFLV